MKGSPHCSSARSEQRRDAGAWITRVAVVLIWPFLLLLLLLLPCRPAPQIEIVLAAGANSVSLCQASCTACYHSAQGDLAAAMQQNLAHQICSLQVWDEEGVCQTAHNLYQSMYQPPYSIQAHTVCCSFPSPSRRESGRSSPDGYVSTDDGGGDILRSNNTQQQLHFPSYVHMDPGAARIILTGSVAQLDDLIDHCKTRFGPDYKQVLRQAFSDNSDKLGSFFYQLNNQWILRGNTKTSMHPHECTEELTIKLTIMLKINTQVLYLMQQQLCEQSQSFEELKLCYFTQFAKSPIKKILEIVVSLSEAKWSADLIRAMLLAYEALTDILPIINKIPSSESDDFYSKILNNMREAFRGIFDNIKNFIQSDMENHQDVPIHPMTCFLVCSVNCFSNHTNLVQSTLAPGEDSNSFGHLLYGVITCWKSMLKGHSELYADPQRQYIFLLNNIDHFNRKTLGLFDGLLSSRQITPDDEFESLLLCWVNCMKEAFISRLKRTCWWRSPRPSPVAFLSKFNETFGGQRTWKIPDVVLRQRLRDHIQDCILPEYRMSVENNSISGLVFCSCLQRDLAEDISDEANLIKAVQGLFEG